MVSMADKMQGDGLFEVQKQNCITLVFLEALPSGSV